ncbi:MAG: hypothetical protein WC884_03820 [Candidatus Paceibacterota bacterium]
MKINSENVIRKRLIKKPKGSTFAINSNIKGMKNKKRLTLRIGLLQIFERDLSTGNNMENRSNRSNKFKTIL